MASRNNNIEDRAQEDDFLGDDAYDVYDGVDLSDDPMVADDRRKGRKERKRERIAKEEREKANLERAALKAEILAELKTEGQTPGGSTSQNRGAGGEESALGQIPRKKSRFSEYLMSVLSGNILSRSEVRQVYPYLLFIAFLMFVYIGNVFRMQQLHRKHEHLTAQVKELRTNSMTLASEKMKATRQSTIIGEMQRRGLPLRESLSPNKVIVK